MSTIQSVTYEGAVAVTNSDSAAIQTTNGAAVEFAGFYTGAGGDITVVTIRGETVKFAGTAAGIIPVAITQVKATGTTPTNIVALYALPYAGKASF